jgi:DNA-binding transcriptional LysR family regulator
MGNGCRVAAAADPTPGRRRLRPLPESAARAAARTSLTLHRDRLNPMDRLLSMRAFVKVVDEGSFAAAARALEADAAGVTRLVADLEAHLGARLLHRTTRRLALTDAGTIYLERARAILSDLEEAESLVSHSARRPSGRVRVLVPPGFSFHQLAKHLPRFVALHPEIAVDMSSTGVIETVDEGYDVSILLARSELERGDFVAHRLAISHVILCASPDYLRRAGGPSTPKDLAEHRALLVTAEGTTRTWSLFREPTGDRSREDGAETALVVHDLRNHRIVSAQHADTLFAAALAGVGIAALPSFVIADALASGALVRVLPDWRMASLTVYAALPTRKYVPLQVRAFTDFLIATFRALGDPWLRT